MQGNWAGLADVLVHLILPTLALSLYSMAIITRMTRSSMLETLNADYIRTARAKGLSKGSVNIKHALRNAMLPVSTVIGLQFGSLLGRRAAHPRRCSHGPASASSPSTAC